MGPLILDNASIQKDLEWRAVIGLGFILLINFATKLWSARRHARLIQKQRLPMPPHNFLLGHLGLVATITKKLPYDAHRHYLADQIRQKYPDLGPAFYLDLWPCSELMLIVTDPAMIAQFCQPDHLLPKHPGVKHFLNPITGGYDLNCLEGESWKFWRRLFNPGFGAGHMLTLIPSIVDEVLIFRENLLKYGREGKMFKLEEHALNLALDVIGDVALDTKLNNQRGHNDMTTALLDQRNYAAFGWVTDFGKMINPMRHFHIWRNTRIMDKYINHALDERYSSSIGKDNSKTIIDLALNSYVEETKNTTTSPKRKHELDPIFRNYALSQMKVFIFAGHDTTASTICYCLLLLSRNPQVLAKVRAEHDAVFGPDSSLAASLLTESPALLNKLPYTLAVIKETLRLFPVVSSPRMGQKDFVLVDSKGRNYPTENCLVWTVHHGLHHNPLWWPRVEEFLPERFLIQEDEEGENAELRPIKNAWRPFEFGPRACIGTELALAEIKVVLALTARDLAIEEAYAEWDQLNGTKGIKTVDGERAYQIQLGSAHPCDGFPARVGVSVR